MLQVCDRTPPVIKNTPKDIPCQEATSAAGAVVSYIHPTATDLVDGAVPVVCVLGAGSTFPLGVSMVVCTATDLHGNFVSTSFSVLVCDRTAPVISGTPANMPCQEATSRAGAVVTYNLPSAFDVVSGAVTVSCVPPSGSTFSLGTNTVVCSASDAEGNSASTSFTILVCDRTPPVIAKPPNVPCVEATSPLGADVTYPLPTASDAADPAVVVTCVKVSGTKFPVGVSTITCSATDASGNKATDVTFTISVCDRTPPVLVGVPPNLPCQEATTLGGSVVSYSPPTASDIVDGAVTVVCTPPSGSKFMVGTTTVTCIATDSRANSVTASFTVKICDTTPPVITGTPANIPCVEATSSQGAEVTYTLPTASDIVDGAVSVTCVQASGRVFPIGTTTVVCTAADVRGNRATSSFTVTVRLHTLLALVLPSFLRILLTCRCVRCDGHLITGVRPHCAHYHQHTDRHPVCGGHLCRRRCGDVHQPHRH